MTDAARATIADLQAERERLRAAQAKATFTPPKPATKPAPHSRQGMAG